jgi:hypothetical protein
MNTRSAKKAKDPGVVRAASDELGITTPKAARRHRRRLYERGDF